MYTKIIPALTGRYYTAKINLLSQKTKAGIGTPFNKGHKRPLSTVVFLCPSKSNTGLIRIKSIMVDCVRRLRPAVPLYGSSNLIQSASNCLEPKRGGLHSYKGEAAMRNLTQKLTNHVSQKPQSRFNVLTRSGDTIALNVPFQTAINFNSRHTDLKIKFSGMNEGIVVMNYTRFNNTLIYTTVRYSVLITEIRLKVNNHPRIRYALNFFDTLNNKEFNNRYDDLSEAMNKAESLIGGKS